MRKAGNGIKINSLKKNITTMKNLISGIILIACISYPALSTSQWYSQDLPADGGMMPAIQFFDIQNGAIGGWRIIGVDFLANGYFTSNSGVSWIQSSIPDSVRSILDIKFLSGSTGIGVGAYNLPGGKIQDYAAPDVLGREGFPDYSGVVLRTYDGGMNWQTAKSTPQNFSTITSVDFIDELTGYICGDKQVINFFTPKISKTTDGGITWQEMSVSLPGATLRRVLCFDKSVYSVGSTADTRMDSISDGFFVMSSNSGASWDTTVFQELHHITDIRFSNVNTGYFSAVNDPVNLQTPFTSSIYKTTNGGINWTKLHNFDSCFIEGMGSFSNSGIALAYGTKLIYSIKKELVIYSTPFINRTSDYGNTWLGSIVLDSGILMNCQFVNETNIYVSGGNPRNESFSVNFKPIVLQTTNGGLTFANSVIGETPGNFILYQNYPNPFNPITNINFRTNSSEQISLKIYDVIGNEIAVLFNGVQRPGNHTVTFDGSNIPSGIYFYKLESKSSSEVKKMILIK